MLGGAFAAGMQPGLGAAGIVAVAIAAWDVRRLAAHRAAAAVAALAAGLGPLLVFVFFDSVRIVEDLAQERAVPGFVEGAWFKSFDVMIVLRQATGLGKVVSVLVPILIAVAVVASLVRTAEAEPDREADALAGRLGFFAAATVGPYVVMAATTDYVSHIGAGQALFMAASAAAARSLGGAVGGRAAAAAPIAAAIAWLAIPGWNGAVALIPDVLEAEPADHPLPRAVRTAERLRAFASDAGGQPLIYFHQHPELAPVTALDPEILNAIVGLGFAGSDAPRVCFVIGEAGIADRLGGAAVLLGSVGDGLEVEASAAVGCRLLEGGCAALPHGLLAAPGRRIANSVGYEQRCQTP
ncbi:MAG: hypothetical protein GY898_28100 [Proteobacteria bacterium]|nr:hypothetical protein [Pseudomonadota bacterium]